MKSKFYLLGVAALALASCSNDEVINENEQGNVIAFRAQTGATSRAADSYCNTNKPADFNVWARTGGKTYFSGDNYNDNDKNGTYVATSGHTRYWPAAEVEFYAEKNNTGTFNWVEKGNPTITGFKPSADAKDQVDLIYAYTKATKPANGTTNINFRHALSQVVFKAKNLNKNLHIEITGVKVVNAAETGTFTYPAAVTDANVQDHNAAGTAGNAGAWSAQTGNVSYNVTIPAVQVPMHASNAVNLTDNKETSGHSKDFSKSLLLVPQKTTAWAPGTNKKPTDPANKGTYLLLNCKIWNVANGAAVNKGTDVLLWGEASASKDIAIPCAFDWAPGKKYIYTFLFNTSGNGGFDPATGEDVLIPMSFTVSVDDFANAANADVPMRK